MLAISQEVLVVKSSRHCWGFERPKASPKSILHLLYSLCIRALIPSRDSYSTTPADFIVVNN